MWKGGNAEPQEMRMKKTEGNKSNQKENLEENVLKHYLFKHSITN